MFGALCMYISGPTPTLLSRWCTYHFRFWILSFPSIWSHLFLWPEFFQNYESNSWIIRQSFLVKFLKKSKIALYHSTIWAKFWTGKQLTTEFMMSKIICIPFRNKVYFRFCMISFPGIWMPGFLQHLSALHQPHQTHCWSQSQQFLFHQNLPSVNCLVSNHDVWFSDSELDEKKHKKILGLLVAVFSCFSDGIPKLRSEFCKKTPK